MTSSAGHVVPVVIIAKVNVNMTKLEDPLRRELPESPLWSRDVLDTLGSRIFLGWLFLHHVENHGSYMRSVEAVSWFLELRFKPTISNEYWLS